MQFWSMARRSRRTHQESTARTLASLGAVSPYRVGSKLGTELRLPVGNELDEALGVELGELLGSELGKAFGPALGTQVGLPLGPTLGDALGSTRCRVWYIAGGPAVAWRWAMYLGRY